MSQLLKITTTPIKIAVNVEQGHYEEVEQKENVRKEVQRQQRVQALQQQQAANMAGTTHKSANVDSYKSQTISASIPVEISAINNVMNMRINNAATQLSEISANAATTSATNVVENYVTTSDNLAAYVPNTTDSIKWEPTTLNLDLELNFNTEPEYEYVEQDTTKLRYVPREISFEVEQYPSIKIEYLGGPQYVPPSSDPNYKGEDK